MGVVAIIPARGGSKRIRHKNIKELWGKPLIAYTIEASLKSKHIDRTIVSTEDAQIKEVALKYGAEVMPRPLELATDEAKTEPVIFFVLKELKKQGYDTQLVALLQATSPLRRAEDIDRAFAQFIQEGADSLVSVTEEYRLYWKDGRPLNYSIENYQKRPRLCAEDMPPFLKENGAIYITKEKIIREKLNRVGGKIALFKMPQETEIELDTRTDWLRLQKKKEKAVISSNRVYIIAEIGCNHQGDIDIAKKMMDVASYCGVDAVKLQKRDVKSYLSLEQYNRIYDNPNSFGLTYGEHREYLELNLEEHIELKEYASSLGIDYFVSVWDAESVKQMLDLDIDILKIPSACITDSKLLSALKDAKVPVMASVGMSTIEEIDFLVNELSAIEDLYLFQCTSTYPCSFDNLNLSVIGMLKKRYQDKVKGIGFSGHHLGIAMDVAAVAMGAEIIERHFTLDRTQKGTDHAASLEPDGMRRLVRDIRAFEKAKGTCEKKRLDCELSAWKKLRRTKE